MDKAKVVPTPEEAVSAVARLLFGPVPCHQQSSMRGNGCPVSVLGGVPCKIVKRYTADCTLVFWMLYSAVDGLPGAPYISDRLVWLF